MRASTVQTDVVDNLIMHRQVYDINRAFTFSVDMALNPVLIWLIARDEVMQHKGQAMPRKTTVKKPTRKTSPATAKAAAGQKKAATKTRRAA